MQQSHLPVSPHCNKKKVQCGQGLLGTEMLLHSHQQAHSFYVYVFRSQLPGLAGQQRSASAFCLLQPNLKAPSIRWYVQEGAAHIFLLRPQ